MLANDVNKVKLAIAARDFLYRLGIKTIISVIGVEPELFEINSYEDILKCLKHNSEIKYLVINEEILPQPMDIHLNEIGKHCPYGKILLIGRNKIDNCLYTNFILNVENQKEIVERFQDFFFEPDINSVDHIKEPLTEREIEVLKSVACGYSSKEIADLLFISINTVITHRKNITEKLGIKTISGLTVYAIMNNIVNPNEVKI